MQSICPYCAVGCGQLAYVKDGEVIQVEGDPGEPDLARAALPEGRGHARACTPGRSASTRSSTAARTATAWEELPLDAGDGDDRRPHPRDARGDVGGQATPEGNPARRTMGIANLGGATLDNEENYLIKKLLHGARASSQVENQARI